MHRNFAIRLLLVIGLTLSLMSCKKDVGPEPPIYNNIEEEISAIADQYVKVGAMVGIIDLHQQKHIYSFGTKKLNTTDPPDENTTFDIGSLTKTFTAVMAANMYIEGKIEDDIISHHLPSEEVTMPMKDGVEITFTHLLTHTSGLPRSPHQEGSVFPLPPGYDEENPYAAYTTPQVYDYLSNYCYLEFTPGTWWLYSNTAVGLAGHVLGLIDGTSYETILKRDFFDVLEMDNSSLFLTETQMLNMADGHDGNKKQVPFFIANDIFQGAGMIKSTLNDMLKYLDANLRLVNSPLQPAMELTFQTIMHQGSMGDQGLIWLILELEDGQEIIYMAGNTNGHSSYMAFNRTLSTGAVILFNISNHDGTNIDMGMELMRAIIKYQ